MRMHEFQSACDMEPNHPHILKFRGLGGILGDVDRARVRKAEFTKGGILTSVVIVDVLAKS